MSNKNKNKNNRKGEAMNSNQNEDGRVLISMDRDANGCRSDVVLVRVEHNYGSPCAYPVNEKGRIFCAMTGCTTLRKSDLERIQALGFEVVVEQRGQDELLAELGVSA